MYLCLGIVIVLIAVSGSNGQESCTTASGGRGTCISIANCAPLLAILRQSANLPPAETEVLRKSGCGVVGNTPKVCCPSSNEQKPGAAAGGAIPLSYGSSGAVPSPPDVSRHPNLRLINGETCGLTTDPKIILGNKTTVLEFPWMVLIGYKIAGRQGIDFQCGGTLINKRWVLTAAHCVTGLRADLELSTVRVGEHDLNKERDCDEENGVPVICADKYQDFLVERFTTHSGYRPSAQNDDIALIRLNGDANIATANNVRTICLPVGDTATLNFNKAVATGWGRTEWGVRSFDLLKVKLDIMPNPECAKVFELNNIPITYKQICAGGKNRRDSCAGDSGGPLQFPNPNTADGVPRYVQYGVVSFGTQACGVEGYPGVYTRVPYYVNWILDNISD